MFYMFIACLAIATIVLYRLKKNLDKELPPKGQDGEKTISFNLEKEQQQENQEESSLLPPPQTIPPPEQQAEISAEQSSTASAAEDIQEESSTNNEFIPEDISGTEQRENTPASLKLTPKQIAAGFAAAFYMLIAMTLIEMEHPLGPALLGILVIGFIVWCIRMPKEQWALLKAAAKEADEREARSPFRKALKVIGVSIIIVIILIILIEFFGKYL